MNIVEMIREALEEILKEKAKSKAQHGFMWAVKRCKEEGDCPSDKIRDAASSMTKKEIEDFTKGSSKGLPKKVKIKRKKKS
jgi:hypothetical protein